MNGRAIDFEHWDSTLREAKVFGENPESSSWVLTEDNYKAALAALEINDDAEINAELRSRFSKGGDLKFSTCKKRFLSLFAMDVHTQQFKTPA
jgi:hypothetical protein